MTDAAQSATTFSAYYDSHGMFSDELYLLVMEGIVMTPSTRELDPLIMDDLITAILGQLAGHPRLRDAMKPT